MKLTAPPLAVPEPLPLAPSATGTGVPASGSGVLAEWAAAYRERLLAAAGALCGDRVEAEDLLQETFSEAAAALPRFEGRSAPYTWLYGILRHRFLLQCRRRRRFFRWAASAGRITAGAGERELGEAADRSSEVSCDPRLNEIAVALRGLSAKHREVLHLRYVEGRKIGEIARLVAASEGTVKSRLHHALRRVQSAVGRSPEPALTPAREKAHEL
jgi:RNA polymerase sigma-70 factor (ECF subfamily)